MKNFRPDQILTLPAMEDNHKRLTIKDIQRKVKAMIVERQRLLSGEAAMLMPSDYWADVCSAFDYMLELPEKSFSKFRVHTYHVTGDSYIHYDSHRDAQAFRTSTDLDGLIKDIPSDFVLNEPKGGIGFAYEDGRFVNIDVLRYQRVINTLYRRGILSTLTSDGKQFRGYVLEIGGGFGGLAHHMTKVVEGMTYVIVDLPETLMFSAAYLSMLNPDKKIYLYDKDDFAEFINSPAAKEYDFILVPSYQFRALDRWQFDLAINTISFQEMNRQQVEEYLEFISKTCVGVLYVWNIEFHMTASGIPSMPEMLKSRFEFVEMPARRPEKKAAVKVMESLKTIASALGLINYKQPRSLGKYIYGGREYVCTPIRKIERRTDAQYHP